MNASPVAFQADTKFANKMKNRFILALFMGAKLPLGLMAGLRVDKLDEKHCAVSVPYGWRSKNPFRSIYFAAQCMAAEMSTGVMAMFAIRSSGANISMLVTGMDAEFVKKATKRATFRCENGQDFFNAVHTAIETGEAQTIKAHTVGSMPDGTVVSRFNFTWSIKLRSRKAS